MKDLTNYLLKAREINKEIEEISRNEKKNYSNIASQINEEVKKITDGNCSFSTSSYNSCCFREIRLDCCLKHKITNVDYTTTLSIELNRLKEKKYLKRLIEELVGRVLTFNDKIMKSRYENIEREIEAQQSELNRFKKYFKEVKNEVHNTRKETK